LNTLPNDSWDRQRLEAVVVRGGAAHFTTTIIRRFAHCRREPDAKTAIVASRAVHGATGSI